MFVCAFEVVFHAFEGAESEEVQQLVEGMTFVRGRKIPSANGHYGVKQFGVVYEHSPVPCGVGVNGDGGVRVAVIVEGEGADSAAHYGSVHGITLGDTVCEFGFCLLQLGFGIAELIFGSLNVDDGEGESIDELS